MSNQSQSQQTTHKRKRATSSHRTNVAPIFLRKTYELIDSCDAKIATWADDGLSFIVKDADRFAAESIPRCFKHNNFSSFVRQLNFYGFRKLRDDNIFLKDVDTKTVQWSAFHHPRFVRGHPEWLVDIKKTNQVEPADKTEVDSLKKEVASLKSLVKNLQINLEIVTTLLNRQQQSTGDKFSTLDPMDAFVDELDGYDTIVSETTEEKEPVSNKRMKVSPVPAPVLSSQASNTLPPPLPKLVDVILPEKVGSMQRETSAAISLTSKDGEFLDSLMLLDDDMQFDFKDEQLPPLNELPPVKDGASLAALR